VIQRRDVAHERCRIDSSDERPQLGRKRLPDEARKVAEFFAVVGLPIVADETGDAACRRLHAR